MRVVAFTKNIGKQLWKIGVGWPWRLVFRQRRFVVRPSDSSKVDDMRVIVKIAAAGNRLSRSLMDGDVVSSEQGVVAIQALVHEIRNSGKPMQPHRVENQHGPITFIVNSLFLADAARYLIPSNSEKTFVERFHFVAGAKVGERAYMLNHIIPVQFAEQSAVYLRVDNLSNFAALEALDYWGMPLVSHFHSHPGAGAAATHPSGIDQRFQERLEKGGHIAVGGIFSRGGFVRFFAGDDRRFQIQVVGNHVKEIEPHVYKISLGDGDLPIHSTTAGRSGQRR